MDREARCLRQMLGAEDKILEQIDHLRLASSCCSDTSPNVIWREKVAQWFYDVADHLGESRSIVYVAMNILDRYCVSFASKNEAPLDERQYEISSMTAMFLAARISGSGNLRIPSLLRMSRGGITTGDIVSTGSSMIKDLTWGHRILTPAEFVAAFAAMVSVEEEVRTNLIESASYLVELAVCDRSLSRYKASELALSAVVNAMRATVMGDQTTAFIKGIKTATNLNPDSEETHLVRRRLHRIYTMSYDSRQTSMPHLIPEDDMEVSQAFQSSAAVRNISDPELVPQAQEISLSQSRKRLGGLCGETHTFKRSRTDLTAI